MSKPAPWLIPAVWVGGLMPVPMLAWQASHDALGANPVNEALNRLGMLTFIALLASLSCTPLKTWVGWVWPIRIRKHLGLLAFTYACLHFSMWAAVDQGLDVKVIFADVTERPFVTVGFLAWLSLVPVALTSSTRAVQRLGFTKWKRVHRLVYATGFLACIHFVWREKTITVQSLAYVIVFTVLMVLRVAKR